MSQVDLAQPVVTVPVSLFGVPGTSGGGSWILSGMNVTSLEGQVLYLQAFIADPSAAAGYAMTNAIAMSIL